MSVASKIPPLRFKGFEGEWDKKCFSDFAKVRRGLTYSPMDCAKHEIRVLRSSNIEDDKFVLHDDDVFVKKESANISSAEVGDILITAANGSSQLVGKHALIRGIAACTAVHGGFMLLATSTESVFLNAAMSAPWYRNTVASLMMGGNGALGNLCQDAFETMMFIAPQGKKERDQLGIIFRSLDALIADRESAVEKLQTLKKAMLERMFPRAGAKVPEMRFKGFGGVWGKVRLDNVCTMFSGGTPTSTNHTFYGGDIDWVSISDMTKSGKYITETEKKLTQEGFENCSAKMFPPSTLLFAMYASIGKCCIAPKSVCSSQAILGLYNLDGVDVEFLYYDLSRREKMFAKMGQMGSQANLSKTIVSEIEVNMPPTFEEQQKIGAYFRSLDALISARQKEVGKLKDLKKALLDRMFV